MHITTLLQGIRILWNLSWLLMFAVVTAYCYGDGEAPYLWLPFLAASCFKFSDLIDSIDALSDGPEGK